MSVVAFKEKSRVLAELWLLFATALLFSSTVPAPALAQTVSFNARLDFAVETQPIFVAVGDFNGDRVQDLAVANRGSASVSVLLGNGDGTFRAAPTVAVGTNPFSVAVGDFNRDGLQDLAVTNFGSNNVSVLLGNGDGTFRAPLTFGVGINPHFVAIGDFNRDVGCKTWRWPILARAAFRCCWATATGPSGRR